MTDHSSNISSRFLGVLPAAGAGSRLKPFSCPKELLPIAFESDPITGAVRPMLAAEHSMRAMEEAGIKRCVMVISDRKAEMMRYFGDGSPLGMSIAYVNQTEPRGLAAAIDVAYDWVFGYNVCLALPDTVFSPRSALGDVAETLLKTKADVVLGVFPTKVPQQLGPVRMDDTGQVIEVLEKPESCDLENTWGIAAWGPRFTQLLHARRNELTGLSIGHIFNQAVLAGLDVRAVAFENGSYMDLGTGAALAALVLSARHSDEWR